MTVVADYCDVFTVCISQLLCESFVCVNVDVGKRFVIALIVSAAHCHCPPSDNHWRERCRAAAVGFVFQAALWLCTFRANVCGPCLHKHYLNAVWLLPPDADLTSSHWNFKEHTLVCTYMEPTFGGCKNMGYPCFTHVSMFSLFAPQISRCACVQYRVKKTWVTHVLPMIPCFAVVCMLLSLL